MTGPSGAKASRDGLGRFFFGLHLVILAFIVLGWLLPLRAALLFYLVFLPAVALQWQCNHGSCALNNLESLLRYGRWRVPEKNPEEGAWLRGLIAGATGIAMTGARVDALTYGAMALFWLLGLAHFARLA